MVVEINNENFEQEVLKSNKIVLIDFYAEWCGPCQMLSPIVEQVAQENDNIKVVKVNVDENQSLAVEFGIKAIPTLIVIKEGKEANRAVGMLSKAELLELVK
ncbi:MAG: thioredoxin [Clostridia bacterium]|nr:thioredoxin [Clostridia bacterium]